MASLSRQVANQQGRLDNIGAANEGELGAYLESCALDINPAGSVQVLQRTPFCDERGQVGGSVLLGAAGGDLVAVSRLD